MEARPSFSTAGSLQVYVHPRTQDHAIALLTRAKMFACDGDYAEAVGMLRRALFATPRAYQSRESQVRSILAVWRSIRFNFKERVRQDLNYQYSSFETMLNEKRKLKGKDAKLPEAITTEFANDQMAVHGLAIRIGMATEFLWMLCESDEPITDDLLLKVQEQIE